MAIQATATPSIDIKYTLKETDSTSTITEYGTAGYSLLQFTNGTGTGNIDIGVVITGSVSSGSKVDFDFRLFPKFVFGQNITLDFTSKISDPPHPIDDPQRGVKAILVSNAWNGLNNSGLGNLTGLLTSGNSVYGYPVMSGFPQLNVHATGEHGFSGLFGAGIRRGSDDSVKESGNITLNPSGSWGYTDIVGRTPIFDVIDGVYQHKLTISAENFNEIYASGATGADGAAIYYPIWNDNTEGNPWSGNVATIPYQIAVIGVTG